MKQPEALRWVHLLEHEATAHGPTDYKHKAAAELRRLAEVEKERDRLHEANQALIEALEKAASALEARCAFGEADAACAAITQSEKP